MKKYITLLAILIGSFSLGASVIPPDTSKSKMVIPFGADCKNIQAIYTIIGLAIESGAPTYNTGNHLACYMIYEGAAYKILYKYGLRCSEVSNLLEASLEKCTGNYSATDKAWILRMAFDKILGEPTQTKAKEK